MVGDVSPIAMLTKTEVVSLGRTFAELPQDIIDKPPSGGLTGGSMDEEVLGFSYEVLDRYLICGERPDDETMKKIQHLRDRNRFKLHKPRMFHIEDFPRR